MSAETQPNYSTPTVSIEYEPKAIAAGTIVSFKASLDWTTRDQANLQEGARLDHPPARHWKWRVSNWAGDVGLLKDPNSSNSHWDSTGVQAGSYKVDVTVEGWHEELGAKRGHWHASTSTHFDVTKAPYGPPDEIPVRLRRSGVNRTADIVLWTLIRRAAESISFEKYNKVISSIMCGHDVHKNEHASSSSMPSSSLALPFPGVDAYKLLKASTEVFLMAHCGVNLDHVKLNQWLQDTGDRLDETITESQAGQLIHEYLLEIGPPADARDRTIPYLDLIRHRLPEVGVRLPDGNPSKGSDCYGILLDKLTKPCLIELIWSYWQEEGMLVQTMNAISLRFQNRRTSEPNELMSRLDIDPLRPMGNLLWGYIQDEQHRLSVLRRAYEYDHQYGITMVGRAVQQFRPADSRSKFLEAFHNLLHLTAVFYTQDDDTTVIADGFPLLNTIREVHLILAEGAHNQFGDLPSTARQEMLMQQWLLARPEMREFLGGRIMVPYAEPWMDRVDTVKRMYGWTDTTVTHFHELAIYGERLLLSIRYGNWSDINTTAAQAANWARFWRPEVQGYLHAYRAATGVDLAPSEALYLNAARERGVQPSALLRKRLALQHGAR
jgi:hypothetical protein